MNTAAKLSAYSAALALLITGGYAVGTTVGPLSSAEITAPTGPVAEAEAPVPAPAEHAVDGHGR